jgi:cobalt transporter subunit CbtB
MQKPLEPQVRRPAEDTIENNGLTEGDMTTQTISTTRTSVSQRILAGMACIVLGVCLTFGVGLAQDDRLHNAAHDTRHAIGFPCH